MLEICKEKCTRWEMIPRTWLIILSYYVNKFLTSVYNYYNNVEVINMKNNKTLLFTGNILFLNSNFYQNKSLKYLKMETINWNNIQTVTLNNFKNWIDLKI